MGRIKIKTLPLPVSLAAWVTVLILVIANIIIVVWKNVTLMVFTKAMIIMKKLNFFFLAIVTMLISSCANSSRTKTSLEFWETNNDFEAPAEWISYTYGDAFKIKIPPYMKENAYENVFDKNKLEDGNGAFMSAQKNMLSNTPLSSGQTAVMTFSARHDGIHNGYARIFIQYIKANEGDFLDCLDYIDIERADFKAFCNQIIKTTLGAGKLIKIRRKDTFYTHKSNMSIDLCYQRVGVTENNGPVTVHNYFLQNTDEAVLITVSFNDKNKEQYKDLFNIVQTLEWLHFKSKN